MSNPSPAHGTSDRVAILVPVLQAVAIVVALRHLLTRALWYNEQWRAWHISLNRQFLGQLSRINSPMAAGWVALTKASVLLFGNTEIALRLPVAFSTPALAWVGYLLARRWLSVRASVLTMVALLANVMIMTYSTQLAPYDLEAACTVAVLLLWLSAGDQGTTRGGRWARYLGMGALALLATPVVFVLGPLLLIDLARAGRRGAWWQLGPATAAGGGALAHLVLYIGRQTAQSKDAYWDDFFLPHDSTGRAVGFAGRQLASYVPTSLTGQSSYLRNVPEGAPPLHSMLAALLTGFILVGLVSGLVVTLTDPGLRPLPLVIGGCLAAQLVASALRLWPFGFTRVNTFLLPLGYLLAAVGITRSIAALSGGNHTPGASLLLAGLVIAVALTTAGYLDVLAVGGRQLAAIRANATKPAFASGMPELVALTRRHAGGNDIAVVIHPMARKGWDYYMRFHKDGSRLAGAPRIGPDHTLVLPSSPVGSAQLQAFIAAQPAARHLFVMALRGTSPQAVHEVLRTARLAGFQRNATWRAPSTGGVIELARTSP